MMNPFGRPAVSADNHNDAVLTPPNHRGSYGLQSVNHPKYLHSFQVGRRTYRAVERAPTRSSIRSQGERPETGAPHR